MPIIEPFEVHFNQYENWFVGNHFVYQSELEAVRPHLSNPAEGLEIGVGSGLFAGPLGISYGVDPAQRMIQKAVERGVKTVKGCAEQLPFKSGTFGFALMVTSICFFDEVPMTFEEASRVLRSRGRLAVGFVDKSSRLGKEYEKHKNENVFYRKATFYSANEILFFLKQAGFQNAYCTQTIFQMLNQIIRPEPVREGYGQGGFVVCSGVKK